MLVQAAYYSTNYKCEIHPQKYGKNNGWNVVEDLKTDNERKKQKLRTKKYGKTRAVAYKNCHLKAKQSCTKHQKYHNEITKNMKSLLQENFW